jgi:GntR family transcriptional repressor for pyruvate dehydrogenase complex
LSDNLTNSALHRPVERRNTYELIAENVLALITERRLKPGDPLPTERELTESYGVGRSSVREALRVLESKGVIRSSGKRSFAVAEYGNPLNHSMNLLLTLQEADLHDLFEVRRVLEVEAAALAAVRRTDDDLARMARAVDEMQEGLDSEERYIAADVRFHLAIAEATRNRISLHLMHAIRDLLHRALASIYHIPGSAERSLEQHEAILAAITKGDAGSAREAMRRHLTRVEGEVHTIFGDGGRGRGRAWRSAPGKAQVRG